MATQYLEVLIDDLTGATVDEVTTVPFAFDGVDYQIDLSPASYAKMHETLQPYLGAAHRIGRTAQRPGTSKRPSGVTTRPDPAQLRAIRDWWASNWRTAGLREPVNRGRIPRDVVAAYEQAGGRTLTGPPEPPGSTDDKPAQPQASATAGKGPRRRTTAKQER
jgi:hypothetical protein